MRIWLIGITTEGHKEDLKELIDPIKDHFNGLIWTFHYPIDEGYDYLESVKGEGETIKTKWCNRLDFSRNHSLFQGPMQVGDWFMTIDTLERLSSEFTKNLRSLCSNLDSKRIDGVYLHNKRFLFKFKENTCFVNNPHEGIVGCSNTIELTNQPFWKEEYQKNVRSEKRKDPLFYINHNFKYYLFPNSNHLVLGLEHDPDLIKKRYHYRSLFLKEVYEEGFYPFDPKSAKECVSRHLTKELKECINFDKFLNDWYRYEILGEREGFVDSHDFKYVRKIDFLK
jgi:hypothetical protein